MAITIDYSDDVTPQYVINIPRADMLDVTGSSPTEIRQLNIDDFRKELNDLMDEAPGIAYPTNHIHTAPLTISGVTLARVVEILVPYVILFEDGLYNVNIVGGNSNIADRTIKNQVGVNTSNSAGLTFSKEVEDQSFTDARIWVDTVNGNSGVSFPRGTPGSPVNNLSDAQAIIEQRGFPKRLALRGVLSVQSGDNIDDYNILGSSANLATLNVDPAASTNNVVVEALTVQGDLSGNMTARQSTSVVNLIDFDGSMANCGIDGTLFIADDATVILDSCYSEVPGNGAPVVSMGANSELMLRNYSGGIEIQNCTAGCTISCDLDPGTLHLGPTNTGGSLKVRGTGVVIDNSAGTTVADDSLVKADEIQLMYALAANRVSVSGTDPFVLTIYDEDAVTPIATYEIASDGLSRTRTS